jgi:2,3-bisphosphoglycerate-independent phosphoglycerate mutase
VVAVLVILDGASEPLGGGPTSLERARTPALDALCGGGSLSRVRTVAPGLPVGSETAIPALLGWVPPAVVDRGLVEAAAHEVRLAVGERAWRVDVLDHEGGRAVDGQTARTAAELRAALAPRCAVHRLAGHRLLVLGPPPLSAELRRFAPLRGAQNGAALRIWPEGVVPPRVLDASTTVVAARGAAAGIGRLMGARVVVPPGATGQPDTDLAAKARAAIDAIDGGAARVVVHIGAPDEAAHALDPSAKVAAIERADRELLIPLVAATRRAKGTLRVMADHGCDPRTGAHDDAPVPCLDWPARDQVRFRHRRGDELAPPRLTERALAGLPVVEIAEREAVAA